MSLNLATRVERRPDHCVWEITTACILRCIHCELAAGTRDPDELGIDELLPIADDLAEAGCRKVSLTGGEPLLNKSWPLLAKRLAAHGITVKVVTNGLLLDDDVVDTMHEVGVHGVSVSLDGMRDEHDRIRRPPGRAKMPSRFDSAIAAIRRVVASPLKTAVITHIHLGNLSELAKMYELLAGLGVELWQLQLAYPLGRLLAHEGKHLISPSDLPDLEARIGGFVRDGRMPVLATDNIGYYGRHESLIRSALHGKHTFWTGCMAGCRGVCICSNGDVKGCPSQPEEFVAGNLRKEPFSTIWNDTDRFAYNTKWDDALLERECATCEHRSLCRAGCTTMAYAVSGTIYDNPFCLQRCTS